MKTNYIYIIKEREFVRLNESTYRIGKTHKGIEHMMSMHPTNSVVVLFRIVDDCDLLEKDIINVFGMKFRHMKRYGNKYFSGDHVEMIDCIDRIVNAREKYIRKLDMIMFDGNRVNEEEEEECDEEDEEDEDEDNEEDEKCLNCSNNLDA